MSSDPTSKYAKELQLLSPLFPDWDDQALAGVLADTKGNVEEAALLISEGRASKFTTAGSRKKEKKPTTTASSSKTANNHTSTSDNWASSTPDAGSSRGGLRGGRGGTRGGRGGRGGFESARGGRGGRGGARGGRGGFKGAQLDAPKVDAADGWTNSDTANAWGVSNETPAAEGLGSTTTASTAEPSKPAPAKAPEPTGPPPISWKSIVAGTAKSKPAPTPTNAAGLEALENEINGTTVNDSVPTSATSEETPAVSASSIAVADNVQNTEEFNASGGWGDAPAQSETDAAAKAVGWDNAPAGTADVAAPAVAKKSSMIPKNTKMSWAQIARPVAKPVAAPKAVPAPPAPPAEAQPESTTTEDVEESPKASEEVAQQLESSELAAQALDQPEVVPDQEPKAPAPVDAVPDAPVPEVEEENTFAASAEEPVQTAEVTPEEESSSETAQGPWQTETQAPVANESQESTQPAAPSQSASQAIPTAAYNGPPGLNPAGKPSAPAPVRTSSRAASRFPDGKAVVMPGSTNSGAGLDMQFGSLSFGNASAGPEPAQTTEPLEEHKPAPAAEVRQAPAVVPQPAVQPAQQAQVPQTIASMQQQPSATQPPSQPIAQQVSQAQQPAQSAFPVQSVYGQSQAGFYQPNQLGGFAQSQLPGQQQGMFPQQYYQQSQSQAAAPAPASETQPAQPTASANTHAEPTGHLSQQGYYGQQQQQQQSAQQDYQSRFAQDAQGLQQQQQPQQSLYGGYPQSQYNYGQPQVQQTQTLGNDMYSSDQQRSLYDSYASGYGRQGVQEAPKQATPQPAAAQTSAHQPQPAQQAQQAPPQFYSGMNTGYYAPYNPYFQYAPGAPYQQYFPMGQPARAPYSASPASPAGPVLGQAGNKPSAIPTAQSPYVPHQTYASAGGYEDNSHLNRFNDNKLPQQQSYQQGYQTQGGLNNFLGGNNQASTAASGVPGRSGNDEDIYKNGSLGSLSRGQAGNAGQAQQPAQQQQQQQQQQQFGYTNAAYPPQQDWNSYAQYGSRGTQQGYWGQ